MRRRAQCTTRSTRPPSRARTRRERRLADASRLAAAEDQKKMSDEPAAVRVQLEAEWAEIERQRAMQIREEHRRQVAHHTSQLEMETRTTGDHARAAPKAPSRRHHPTRARLAATRARGSPRTPTRHALVTPGRMGDPPSPSNHPFAAAHTPHPTTSTTGARPQDASRENASPLRDGRSSRGGLGRRRRVPHGRELAALEGGAILRGQVGIGAPTDPDGPDVCDGEDDGGARRRGGGGCSDRTGCSAAARREQAAAGAGGTSRRRRRRRRGKGARGGGGGGRTGDGGASRGGRCEGSGGGGGAS